MANASAGILITGSEILDGRVLDTNSHFLIQRLEEHGICVRHTLSCTDDVGDIGESLSFLYPRVDILIVSGGLGPTSDDVSSEAVAAFCGEALELREDVLRDIEQLFRSRKRTMDPSNRKQAMFPASAVVLQNPVGTAPGFFIEPKDADKKKIIFVLPGVPSELQAMLQQAVLPTLLARGNSAGKPLHPCASHMFRIFGLPESVVGSRVSTVSLPQEVTVSYRAHFPEIHVVLKSSLALCSEYVVSVREAIGQQYIFSEDKQRGFADGIQALMNSRNATLSLAESCTGGLIGSLITAVAGSSRYFLGAAVTYSNALKTALVQVPPELIASRGAVSFEVASAMAAGARRAFGSDVAISVTGIAGPQGGTIEKPAGTFFVGFSNESETNSYHCFFQGERERVRVFAAYTALDILRRRMLSFPISFPSFAA